MNSEQEIFENYGSDKELEAINCQEQQKLTFIDELEEALNGYKSEEDPEYVPTEKEEARYEKYGGDEGHEIITRSKSKALGLTDKDFYCLDENSYDQCADGSEESDWSSSTSSKFRFKIRWIKILSSFFD